LGRGLETNATLTCLEMRRNYVGEEGAASLLEALTKSNITLTILSLDGNDNISEAILSVVAAFIDANKRGTRLLRAGAALDLSSKRITGAQAKQIATELADNTTVTTLVLNKNSIGHHGCVDIANALIKNRVLTSIAMNDNSFGDDGCSALAAALRVNKGLTKILLNGNGIGLAGAGALAESLRINVSLRELELGRNNVGDDGAVAIAGALKGNEMLERLNLSDNSVSDEGAVAILKVLMESNCSMTWLNLEDNIVVSPGLQKDIGFVLASHRVLKSFRKCLCKPLDKKLMPLVIHSVQMSPTRRENPELGHSQEMVAGPIFLLVRVAALNGSKVVEPSRGGLTSRGM
jgi:NLR family CARD domain-containing protein 3